MFINLNPETIGLGQVDFNELMALAPSLGFQGIDFPANRVGSVSEARDLRCRLADAGLRWGLCPLPCDFLSGGAAEFERGIAALVKILPVVEAAGCSRAYSHVWPGSDEREFEANFAWHVERLQRLFAVLSSVNVRLGIEFIGPKTLQATFRYPFIRTLREAASLADAVGGGLGIVVDCFHWYTSGGTLAELRSVLAGRPIVNVHVNDATAGRARDEQIDLERAMPLETGLVDAIGVLRVLRDLGYSGPVIAEPFNPNRARFSAMGPRDVLGEVGRAMRHLFECAEKENTP